MMMVGFYYSNFLGLISFQLFLIDHCVLFSGSISKGANLAKVALVLNILSLVILLLIIVTVIVILTTGAVRIE